MKLEMVPIQGKEKKFDFHFEQINPYIAPPIQFQQQQNQWTGYMTAGNTNGTWYIGNTAY
jgi:hypothetical protein